MSERFFIANFHQEKITEDLAKSFVGKPFVNENGVTVGHIVSAEVVDEQNIKYTVEMYPHFEVPK